MEPFAENLVLLVPSIATVLTLARLAQCQTAPTVPHLVNAILAKVDTISFNEVIPTEQISAIHSAILFKFGTNKVASARILMVQFRST